MHDVTPESIARAKAMQQQERMMARRKTGKPITDGPPYLIHCPREGCPFVGSARTDGGAVRSISAHLVGAHMKEAK